MGIATKNSKDKNTEINKETLNEKIKGFNDALTTFITKYEQNHGKTNLSTYLPKLKENEKDINNLDEYYVKIFNIATIHVNDNNDKTKTLSLYQFYEEDIANIQANLLNIRQYINTVKENKINKAIEENKKATEENKKATEENKKEIKEDIKKLQTELNASKDRIKQIDEDLLNKDQRLLGLLQSVTDINNKLNNMDNNTEKINKKVGILQKALLGVSGIALISLCLGITTLISQCSNAKDKDITSKNENTPIVNNITLNYNIQNIKQEMNITENNTENITSIPPTEIPPKIITPPPPPKNVIEDKKEETTKKDCNEDVYKKATKKIKEKEIAKKTAPRITIKGEGYTNQTVINNALRDLLDNDF